MGNSQEELKQIIMNLITYSSDVKSNSIEAIYAAKEGDFDEVDEKLKQADQSLNQVHKDQTTLSTQEVSVEGVELRLLKAHAQDQLVNAISFKGLAAEIIDVHKKLLKSLD